MPKMIDRTEARFGSKPDWIAADTAYGSSENLAWLTLKRQILPFVHAFDKSERKDGTWSRSDVTWDEHNDRYICPEGKELRHTRRKYSDPARTAPRLKARKYRTSKADCLNCPAKSSNFFNEISPRPTFEHVAETDHPGGKIHSAAL